MDKKILFTKETRGSSRPLVDMSERAFPGVNGFFKVGRSGGEFICDMVVKLVVEPVA